MSIATVIPYSWYYFAPTPFICIGPSGNGDNVEWFEIEPYELGNVRMEDTPHGWIPHVMHYQIYNLKKKHNMPVDLPVHSQIPYTP